MRSICYIGDYQPDYPRHRVLINGLRFNGVEVVEVNIRGNGLRKYGQTIKRIRELNSQVDAFLVGYSNSRYVPLIKFFAKKPVLWDSFYSIYDNYIFDRKVAPKISLKAAYYWIADWASCMATDIILLDTYTDIDYFVKTFHIPKKKFLRVWTGADDQVMREQERTKFKDKFIVEFHGKYIPVQGTEFIIRAAKLLESKLDIRFIMVGGGQEYNRILKLAEELRITNVEFIPKVPFEKIPDFIANADVCLGLLGSVPRVVRAIPNKVYEAALMKRACINADTPAARELFTDKVDIMLCKTGDPQALADAILELYHDPALKNSIAQRGYEVVKRHATPTPLGKIIIDRFNASMTAK